ncbi:MAG: glycine zipper domain-containing protein [Planctomycetia bacterium]
MRRDRTLVRWNAKRSADATSLAALVLVAGSTVGCQTFAEKGLAVGGLLGAATGAVVGSATGDAGAGAAIGGVLGAATGAIVGDGLDEVDHRNQVRLAHATAAANVAPPTNIPDVVHMARSGIGDDVIISTLHAGPPMPLSATDIVSLHQQGVSDRVIQAMIDRSRRSAAVVASPVVYHQGPPVYVVEPPRTSVSFGVGVPYYHRPYCGPYRGCW